MTTKTVGNNRLLKLADFLETLPADSINMEAWWQPVGKGAEAYFSDEELHRGEKAGVLKWVEEDAAYKLSKNVTPEAAKECGFAACAIGWAATYKPFRRAGLVMQIDVDTADDDKAMEVSYDGEVNAMAVELFFGLQQDNDLYTGETEEWEYLFGPYAYPNITPSPEKVAKRIRKFVARRVVGKPGMPKKWHADGRVTMAYW